MKSPLSPVPVVTIDGPAASGKSSVSRELAARYGWSWVSTGAFYRGIALACLKNNLAITDLDAVVKLASSKSWEVRMTQAKTEVWINGQDSTQEIHGEEVGALASQVSALPEVRKALLQAQRDCVKRCQGGLIAEGRDCGSVVFPNAVLKIYLEASPELRAARRAQETQASLKATIAAQKERDQRDSTRKVAPLQLPDGGVLINTDRHTLEEVVDEVDKLFQAKSL